MKVELKEDAKLEAGKLTIETALSQDGSSTVLRFYDSNLKGLDVVLTFGQARALSNMLLAVESRERERTSKPAFQPPLPPGINGVFRKAI